MSWRTLPTCTEPHELEAKGRDVAEGGKSMSVSLMAPGLSTFGQACEPLKRQGNGMAKKTLIL